MNLSSVTLYRETLSKNQQGPAGKTSRWKRGKWGLSSAEVLEIRGLSFGAKAVFQALSIHGKGNEIIGLSHGQIASAIGGERSTVAAGLEALERLDLIERHGEPSGRDQIQEYRMLHPLMVRRERSIPKVGEKKSIALRPCCKCRKPCVPNLAGICRGCNRKAEVRTIARQEARIVVAESRETV